MSSAEMRAMLGGRTSDGGGRTIDGGGGTSDGGGRTIDGGGASDGGDGGKCRMQNALTSFCSAFQ